MPYQPIEDYGVIGNLRTVALVSKQGSIDWFCYPRFDSPSLFGAILDQGKGGHFSIAPACDDVTYKQFYWPETNILITRFMAEDGVGEIIDYMPVGIRRGEGQGYHGLVRSVKCVRGSMEFRMECHPAFNYARNTHEAKLVDGGAKFFSKNLNIALAADIPLELDEHGAFAMFTLREACSTSFELHELKTKSLDEPIGISDDDADSLFHDTVDYWRSWVAKSTYRGRWREIVIRSALSLKLLTYEPTGAIVAAPTCSLPESLGGSRNWDYRYTWIRDAAFTLYALLRIGFTEEATAFMGFLDSRCHEMSPEGSLQVMYGIDGRHTLTEEVLDHLEGYRGSGPVHVGNGAYDQLQLDIYGELMDSVYLYNKHVNPISWDFWIYLRRLTNWVCDHWREKDEAIWEVRGGKREFTYSKVMCWVAVDRALRLADHRSFPADRERWLKVRDEIYEDVMKNGWSRQHNAFVQYYGGDALDASTLVLPLVFFVSPTDPRMLSTLDAINRATKDGGLVSDGLVFRYDVDKTPDGLKGTEGTFNICTFWLVEALTRAGGHDPARLNEARLLFERMLGYANHLGLYAEQTGPRGEALGNFPQAFTHLALISAAVNLDRALNATGQRWSD